MSKQAEAYINSETGRKQVRLVLRWLRRERARHPAGSRAAAEVERQIERLERVV